jgi:hypothetical protein
MSASSPRSSTGLTNNVDRAAASKSKTASSFHVFLPQLPVVNKSLYKPVQESSVLLPKIDEIIGEHEKHPCKWYFARFKGGIASRVRSSQVYLFNASARDFNAFFSTSSLHMT